MTRAQAIEEAARALVDTVDGILAGNVLGSEGSVPRCMDALRSALSLPPDAPGLEERLRALADRWWPNPMDDASDGESGTAKMCAEDIRALLSGKDDR